MADVHDDILRSNRQEETYDALSVSFWRQKMSIPGSHAAMSSVIAKAGLLRIARCAVVPEYRQQFFDAQRDLWNPAMAAAGMLAGVLCENATVENQMLVCTLWPTEADHERYVERDLTRTAPPRADQGDLRLYRRVLRRAGSDLDRRAGSVTIMALLVGDTRLG